MLHVPAPPRSLAWSDGDDLDQAALRRAAKGDAGLCTIVGIDGSFSRRLGAQLAIGREDDLTGSLSDGCLESELVARMAEARRDGAPRLLRYGQGSPMIDFRLPCGAGLDLLVDPRPDRAGLRAVCAALDARRPARLALPVPNDDLLGWRAYQPALRLLAIGVGPELAELRRLASAAGIAFASLSPGDGLTLGRAPRLREQGIDRWTAIVLLFHDHEWELPILDWALRTPALSVGAQGGAGVRDGRREALAALGHDAASIARLRGPIGLIGHARDPRVLALSILSEIVADYEASRECPPSR